MLHVSMMCYLCRTFSLLTAWKTATRLRQTRWHMCTPHSSNYDCTMCSHQLHFVTFAELIWTKHDVLFFNIYVMSDWVVLSVKPCYSITCSLSVSLSDSHLWLPFDEVFFCPQDRSRLNSIPHLASSVNGKRWEYLDLRGCWPILMKRSQVKPAPQTLSHNFTVF